MSELAESLLNVCRSDFKDLTMTQLHSVLDSLHYSVKIVEDKIADLNWSLAEEDSTNA